MTTPRERAADGAPGQAETFRPSRNHRAARMYADQCGLSVFPLAPGSKVPLKGSHAELDGTTDLDRIDEWWGRMPDAGVACALRYTDWFVLDVDARSGGDEWVAAMLGADFFDTLICESGSGWPSAHFWFRRVPALEGFHAKQVPHAPGVELKGLPYGYVAMPPTIHPRTRRPYAWWDGGNPIEDTPADPPAWLVAAILADGRPLRGAPPVPLDVEVSAFHRGRQLLALGWDIGLQLGPGKWVCRCPNEDQHSPAPQRRTDSSCVLFAPTRPGGWGRIYCSHQHCAHVR